MKFYSQSGDKIYIASGKGRQHHTSQDNYVNL